MAESKFNTYILVYKIMKVEEHNEFSIAKNGKLTPSIILMGYYNLSL